MTQKSASKKFDSSKADSIPPKMENQSHEEKTNPHEAVTDTPEVSIVIPEISILNQRLFCTAVYQGSVYNKKTKIWETNVTSIPTKSGNTKIKPRFFLAGMAKDIFIETIRGKEHVSLPFGTEIFVFWPEIDDFSFPITKDPDTLVEYTVLHWTELSGYKIPKDEIKVKK